MSVQRWTSLGRSWPGQLSLGYHCNKHTVLAFKHIINTLHTQLTRNNSYIFTHTNLRKHTNPHTHARTHSTVKPHYNMPGYNMELAIKEAESWLPVFCRQTSIWSVALMPTAFLELVPVARSVHSSQCPWWQIWERVVASHLWRSPISWTRLLL